ncbi:MAG: hypothetical protein JWP55_769 [Mycobacterium sp.]|jgi:hypothetical protein|nr:hypothetical protein [Mycobacterium sp.]
MRVAQWLTALVLGLAACSAAPKTAVLPANFPDLSSFTEETSANFTQSGTGFTAPNEVSCVLDFGPHEITVCNGSIPGVPSSVPGSGCVLVHKADPATSNAPYVFQRSGAECASSRRPHITIDRKLTTKNSTCAIGDGGLIACIDADNQHGFVLQPSGSWAF